jgi:hypothetical protein
MMPVMKNDYDIYKGGKQKRTTSESSTTSTSTTGNGSRPRRISHNSRSECPSLSSSPGTDFVSPRRHHSQPHNMSMARQQFSRSASRVSQQSLVQSPSKNSSRNSTGSSPPKPAVSESSLSKFHTRLVDKLRRSLKKSSSADPDRS